MAAKSVCEDKCGKVDDWKLKGPMALMISDEEILLQPSLLPYVSHHSLFRLEGGQFSLFSEPRLDPDCLVVVEVGLIFVVGHQLKQVTNDLLNIDQ